jgi:hypothetical protein
MKQARHVCSKGCDHYLEDCTCGCDECHRIDMFGDADHEDDVDDWEVYEGEPIR